ncbi:MAG: zinc ribbon domain-containing protein YjdM [Verrucomicrobiales bacterium]
MSESTCPMCEMNDILELPEIYECVTCGHEWEREAAARVVKDANGNVLADGDVVAMVKDLKLKGTSKVLKRGMKSKPIRLVDGDHEIDCKMDGMSIALKAEFVKKVSS